ncbi:MAG: hypothetical protein Q9181_003120 [Wetmoreana brouardii]
MEERTSPIASSSDTSDNDPAESQGGPWASFQQSQNDPSNTEQSRSPTAPATIQKRRRVTRACDECRRKKIKCDGKHPCTHCTVYSYDCTYDQPSNRRRNPAPQYVEALEKRLQKAESLLRNVLPNISLDDPIYDCMAAQQPQVKQEKPFADVGAGLGLQSSGHQAGEEAEKESLLESMVHEAGSLDLDDQGHWDFYGQSSGMIFLRRMREQFGDMLGKPEGVGVQFTKASNVSSRLNSPKSASASPMESGSVNTRELPAKLCARKLCSCALDDATALLRFVHQPTFYTMFDRVYDTPSEEFTPTDQKFLPLLYAVMALGCLFGKAEESMLQSYGYESAIEQGLNWFQVSRQLMDVTDCRDLISLQTLLFMILFLQASAKLSTCFSHIGLALRSAVRMGLHRSVSNQFPAVEKEMRKRVFWVIRNMDIYSLTVWLTRQGALLGLPIMLSDDDIDQELPLEVDDACITNEEMLPMPPGKTSPMAAFNAHVRLVRILAKTVRYVYPLHTMRSISKHAYVVSHAKIREVEQDMQRWMEDLPQALCPGGEAPPELVRVQHLLRLSYGHIQMILYRPFLHYASQSTQAMITDKRTYACAAACVSVSRNVIHITSEMKRTGLLTGAYWFAMYTAFFAILSLVFYVIENPQNPASQEILRDAHEGRDTLASLAPRSMAADRSTQVLAGLFEQLPEALRTGRLKSVSVPQKKRSASVRDPSPSDTSVFPNARPSQSNVQNPTERSSTSSSAASSEWRHISGPYNSPAVPRQPMLNIDSAIRQSPQQVFSPAAPSNLGFLQQNTSTPSRPASATQPKFAPLQSTTGSSYPDMSTMMFPSNNPFAYPNQPMTTIENYQGSSQPQSFGPPIYPNATNRNSYDNYNTPIYGTLLPYPMSGARRPSSMGNSDAEGQPMLDGDQRQNQTPFHGRPGGPPPGSNWDAMFGEDWSGGWADQGYGQ